MHIAVFLQWTPNFQCFHAERNEGFPTPIRCRVQIKSGLEGRIQQSRMQLVQIAIFLPAFGKAKARRSLATVGVKLFDGCKGRSIGKSQILEMPVAILTRHGPGASRHDQFHIRTGGGRARLDLPGFEIQYSPRPHALFPGQACFSRSQFKGRAILFFNRMQLQQQ